MWTPGKNLDVGGYLVFGDEDQVATDVSKPQQQTQRQNNHEL